MSLKVFSSLLSLFVICPVTAVAHLSDNVKMCCGTGSFLDSGCTKWAYNLQIDQSLPVESALKIPHSVLKNGQSHWPRSLKRGSAAACSLEFWFQICPGAWMSVTCECCVLSVEVSASGWSLIQGSPAECVCTCTIECDCEALIMRRPWPTRGCYAMGGGKYWKMVKLLLAASTYFVVCAFTLNGLFVKLVFTFTYTLRKCERQNSSGIP